ncbi:hypothetical protein IYY11_21090 [Methylocystis sp. H62]|uniref:hypothetical protein n=1 Tax=Methylocystis sp. H62 TaxID=2785789 RepID=UPI0018C265B0|nr:hypothetical protein [Methylocystis sp. H62]MBG0795859.1 hypothetical protein [Methylocystis sp. H62]
MTASAERARLREAVEAAKDAQQAVDEARRAQHNATQRWSDANSKVAALTRALEEAEDAPPDRFITELAGDVATLLENPTDELRKARDDAQAESAIWATGRTIAEESVMARERALDLARSRVDEAARRVAEIELDVAAMLARAEAARQATLHESAELMTVMRMLPQSSMRRHEIELFMQRGWHSPNAVERAAGSEAHRKWFAALCADAGATMS